MQAERFGKRTKEWVDGVHGWGCRFFFEADHGGVFLEIAFVEMIVNQVVQE